MITRSIIRSAIYLIAIVFFSPLANSDESSTTEQVLVKGTIPAMKALEVTVPKLKKHERRFEKSTAKIRNIIAGDLTLLWGMLVEADHAPYARKPFISERVMQLAKQMNPNHPNIALYEGAFQSELESGRKFEPMSTVEKRFFVRNYFDEVKFQIKRLEKAKKKHDQNIAKELYKASKKLDRVNSAYAHRLSRWTTSFNTSKSKYHKHRASMMKKMQSNKEETERSIVALETLLLEVETEAQRLSNESLREYANIMAVVESEIFAMIN